MNPGDVKLTWRPRTDPRQARFLLDTSDHFTSSTLPLRNRKWTRYSYLDQRWTSACTGYGGAHILDATPRRRPMTVDTAQLIYEEARRRDQWHGEDYDGSSVLGAMEACKLFGYISSYYWARSLQPTLHALSYHGPMEVGFNWYTGMFQPDSDGFIHPTGVVEGGHALAAGEINADERWVGLWQSWGPPDWMVKLSFEDFGRLLSEQGEAALPTKLRLP